MARLSQEILTRCHSDLGKANASDTLKAQDLWREMRSLEEGRIKKTKQKYGTAAEYQAYQTLHNFFMEKGRIQAYEATGKGSEGGGTGGRDLNLKILPCCFFIHSCLICHPVT